MEINGIGQELSNIYGSAQKGTSVEQEFQKLLDRTVQQQTDQEKNDQELKQACESFEAYYVQQLFKEMRKTVPDGGMFEKNNASEIYTQMLDEEYSKIISEGQGMGIATALYKQLSSLDK
ncbi:rod-binding protein [Vallitaleaceae bacterium 9-2]